MADQKISAMSAASALTGAEVLPVVQSAANVKATTQQVVDAAMTTGLTRQALGSIGTNTTIDWSAGSYATATITGALTFTFSNPAASGKACVAYLQLTNGGSATITWPVSVTWSGGTAPTLRASGVDLLRFYTQDGGTTWFGTSENDEPDTTGLTEPLTVTRATRQSSVLSAASTGETKFQFRDIVRAGLLACKTDVGDELLVLPGLGHPMLRGFAKRGGSGTTDMNRFGVAEATSGTITEAAQSLASVRCLNAATAASANAQAHIRSSTLGLTGGSSAGQGFLTWGIFGVPDASYGSGATGAKIDIGIYSSGAIGADGNRPAARAAMLEYNTNQSDTNWIACVHNGTSNTTADTGLAFTAQKTYWYMIHMPKGGSATYFYICNIDDGTSGSATVSATATSGDMGEMHSITTLTTTARNIKSTCIWTLPGGQL